MEKRTAGAKLCYPLFTGKLYEILKGSGLVAAEVCIETDQIQASKTDEGVNDSANPGDSAENH